MRAVLATLVFAFGSPEAFAASRSPLIAAAMSLSDVLPKAAAAYQKSGGPKVEFTFDATSRLARQIEEGAPIDGFFAADEDWMDELQKKGLVDASKRVDLLTNSLVAVVPASSTVALAGAAGLAGVEVSHVALAGEAVPAGKYARAALEAGGIWKSVAAKVVRAENVRGALRWVASGEADAGIVYETDAASEPRVKIAFRFPDSSHPPIAYPAAPIEKAAHAREAAAFLAYCRGSKAAEIFRKSGFGLARPAQKSR